MSRSWINDVYAQVHRMQSNIRAILRTVVMLHATAPLASTTKYLLRALASWPTATRWAHAVLSDPRLQALAMEDPYLLFRLQRPYQRASLPPETKLHWLREHFAWLAQHWPQQDVRDLHRGRVRLLAELSGSAAGGYGLQLGLAGDRYGKEGELRLELTSQGRPLMTAVFTVHRHGTEHVINIGCLQGAAGDDAALLIRQATRDLHGLRPRHAVLLGVHAIAGHYRIRKVLGVPNDAHIYKARRRTRSRVAANYDSFWREIGGVRLGWHYEMQSPPARRQIEQIDSRKRALYRRRYALEDELRMTVEASLPTLNSGDRPAS